MDSRFLSDLTADLKVFFEERGGVDAAAIFGSVARDTDTPESDVDVMAGVWTETEVRWLIEDEGAGAFSILNGELIALKGVLPRLP